MTDVMSGVVHYALEPLAVELRERPVPASRGKPCRSIWSSSPGNSGTSKPMSSASRPRGASSGWRWR